ncbi:transposase [Streptomyces sp. NPDC000987]|uniref:transposase n=1 Tax=Streptomyces sp. NPDC000987 TaxID=3154374 RepID=UPI003327DE74
MTGLIEQAVPALPQFQCIRPDSASASLIAAGDNPDRLRGEASFAALCGASPVEAPPGKTIRRRLNRGGNQQANPVLFRAVLSRLRRDFATPGVPQAPDR